MSDYQLVGTKGKPRRRPRPASILRSRLARASLAATGLLALVALATVTDSGHDTLKQSVESVKEYGARLKEWALDQPGESEDYVQPTIDALARLVGDNPRFLVKDGWATYGFNNQRYMLESTLLLAKIAGRIPVLPDSIWARSCAVEAHICEENALRFFRDRNAHADVVGSTWNDDGPAYKLSIELFLDLSHLRRTYGPFLTYREFLSLYGINPSLYDESLRWNVTNYTPTGFSTATMPETHFSNRTFVRADRPSPPPDVHRAVDAGADLQNATVYAALDSRAVWTLERARSALRDREAEVLNDDDTFIQQLSAAGHVVPLYTFSDEVLMNKALARPSVELALLDKVEYLTETLQESPYADASIVYLQGNLHDQRKPGGLHFSSPAARQDFVDLVLTGVRAPRRVRALGETLAQKMSERVDGRRWVAAHLRRGDFVGIRWSPAQDAQVHFDQLRKALDRGVQALGDHFGDRLPLVEDPFYLATDEKNATALAYYRSRGAILLPDLLTPVEAATLGWPASYSDVLAVVEQQILARSDYFVGSELSSTSGGAINDRTALGKEDWTWALLTRQ